MTLCAAPPSFRPSRLLREVRQNDSCRNDDLPHALRAAAPVTRPTRFTSRLAPTRSDPARSWPSEPNRSEAPPNPFPVSAPDLRALRASGVNRLLFAAGSWDMMHDHMLRQSRQLARAGFDARFLGLGPVGHLFEPSFADYLPDALEYLREPYSAETSRRRPRRTHVGFGRW